jgi:uncharacterized protein YvpB
VTHPVNAELASLRNRTSREMGLSGNHYDAIQAHLDAYEAAVLAPLITVIDEYVIESNDVGGLDCNDLVSRMNAAGYFLPEGEE